MRKQKLCYNCDTCIEIYKILSKTDDYELKLYKCKQCGAVYTMIVPIVRKCEDKLFEDIFKDKYIGTVFLLKPTGENDLLKKIDKVDEVLVVKYYSESMEQWLLYGNVQEYLENDTKIIIVREVIE